MNFENADINGILFLDQRDAINFFIWSNRRIVCKNRFQFCCCATANNKYYSDVKKRVKQFKSYMAKIEHSTSLIHPLILTLVTQIFFYFGIIHTLGIRIRSHL